MDADWITTETLLSDLRDFENRQAWERFNRRFRVPVERFATRLGLGAAESEDVAQETLLAFAEAYRKGKYDREKGRLSHWLFGIAYRQAQNTRRRLARRGDVERPADSPTSFWEDVPEAGTPGESWDLEWEQFVYEECLRRVREEVEPVTLRAFELGISAERSAPEIAEELGIPLKSVYNAKHRVLKRVRELREQLESTPENR